MDIEVNMLGDGIKQISLTGRLDMKNALLIDTRFTALVAAETGLVVVDMSCVDFIASIGIRLLISNAKALANRGGRLVLCQLQPMVKKTIEATGIATLLPTFTKLEEALSSGPG
jgi:anti-sigma B factor antagonist